MSDMLSQKELQREQLLRLIYVRSQGSTTELIALQLLEWELGWDHRLLLDTYLYLKGEGYLGDGSIGATCLSHKGIKKVEPVIWGMEPEPVLANIIVFNHSHIGNVAQGNSNSIRQHTVVSQLNIADSLRERLSELGDLTEEAHRLIILVASESENRMPMAEAVHAVCEQKAEWKQYLHDFAMQSASGAAGGVLAEVVKFVLGI